MPKNVGWLLHQQMTQSTHCFRNIVLLHLLFHESPHLPRVHSLWLVLLIQSTAVDHCDVLLGLMFGVLSVIEPEIDGMVVSWGYSQSRNINAFDEIFLSEILAVARI